MERASTSDRAVSLMRAYGLTRTQAMLLEVLLGDGYASRTKLRRSIWGYQHRDEKGLDVQLCRMRKKLPEACEIRAVRGVGYELSPRGIEVIQAALKPPGGAVREVA